MDQGGWCVRGGAWRQESFAILFGSRVMLVDKGIMLGDDYQKSALWKQLMRLVADAHGYADAVIQAGESGGKDAAAVDTPRDHAQLAKQLLTQAVELAQAVAADAQLSDLEACRVAASDWQQRVRQLDAVVEMMGVVGLFKPRSLRRTRRVLADLLIGFEASEPAEETKPAGRRKIVRKVTKKKTSTG